MHCPAEIAEIISQILQHGLLRIRTLNDPDDMRSEADHLHNLPRLLVDYRPELLEYYWTVERPCYVERSTPEGCAIYEPYWQALASHVESERETAKVVRQQARAS